MWKVLQFHYGPECEVKRALTSGWELETKRLLFNFHKSRSRSVPEELLLLHVSFFNLKGISFLPKNCFLVVQCELTHCVCHTYDVAAIIVIVMFVVGI